MSLTASLCPMGIERGRASASAHEPAANESVPGNSRRFFSATAIWSYGLTGGLFQGLCRSGFWKAWRCCSTEYQADWHGKISFTQIASRFPIRRQEYGPVAPSSLMALLGRNQTVTMANPRLGSRYPLICPQPISADGVGLPLPAHGFGLVTPFAGRQVKSFVA